MQIPEGFHAFEEQGPFLQHVGPILERDGTFGLLVEERHTNHRGTIQGGLLSTLIDFAMGRAIDADAEDDKDRATVSLTVDYLKPATPGDWVEARTRVERVGGTSLSPTARCSWTARRSCAAAPCGSSPDDRRRLDAAPDPAVPRP